MSKIKIGIIGYGNWVKDAYIPAITYDGRAEIVAISAKSEATLTEIKSRFGNSIAIYGQYQDILNSKEIDAVMIAVPDELHSIVIMKAISSGKAIFYEPPISHKRELIPEVLKCLQEAQQITHADLELGLIPAIGKAAEFIKLGAIGKVQSVEISLKSNWGPEPDRDTNTINRLSLWYVHLLNLILDDTPDRVLLLDGYGTPGRRQTRSTGIFDYNGIWGTLKVNTDSIEKLDITIAIVGSLGEIHIDILTGKLVLNTKEKRESYDFAAKQPYADWPGMRESITQFLDAVISGQPSFANADLITTLQAIGIASEESKDMGNWAIVKS